MKKKRIFIIVFTVLFLLTGCSVESKVKISYDGEVSEKVTILTNTAAFKNDNSTVKQMIESSISNYSQALNFREYESEIVTGDDQSGAMFSKQYTGICSYFQDSIFNQYVYHHMNCVEDNFYITIKNDTNYIPYCENCSDWPKLNKVVFKLTLPIKAEENNADKVDGNTYIWLYDENTTNKDFYIKINKTTFNENKAKVEKQNKRNSLIRNTSIIIGILIFVIVLLFVGVILYKKYKSNKIEY